MEKERVQRRLAAILAADVAGSGLTGADEEGTIARLRALRRELINPGLTMRHTLFFLIVVTTALSACSSPGGEGIAGSHGGERVAGTTFMGAALGIPAGPVGIAVGAAVGAASGLLIPQGVLAGSQNGPGG